MGSRRLRRERQSRAEGNDSQAKGKRRERLKIDGGGDNRWCNAKRMNWCRRQVEILHLPHLSIFPKCLIATPLQVNLEDLTFPRAASGYGLLPGEEGALLLHTTALRGGAAGSVRNW